MATATFAEAIATLKQAIDLELQQLEVFTSSATKNVVGMQDALITGVKGERYPCKPDIFEQTYELVETEE